MVNLAVEKEMADLLQQLAVLKNMSENECLRSLLLEAWEDQQDYLAAAQAMAEYRKNPITYSMDEVGKELGFDV